MNFFRLLKGELNKILMRPILYIITGLVIVSIIFSYFQFNPQERTNNDRYFSAYENCETVSALYSTFNDSSNSYGKTKADEEVNIAKENFALAQSYNGQIEPGSKTITEYFNYLIGYHQQTSPEPTSTLTAYNQYLNEQNWSKNVVNDQASDSEIKALINLVGEIENSGISYSIPDNYKDNNLTALNTFVSDLVKNHKILIPAKNYNNLLNIFEQVEKEIILNSRTNFKNLSSHQTHNKIREFLKSLNIIQNLQSFSDNIKLKTFSEKSVNKISANITKAESYLTGLNDEIVDLKNNGSGQDFDKMQELCVRYYLVANNINSYVNNISLYEPILNLSDKEISNLYGYSTNPSDLSDNSMLNVYNIKETLSKQEYLINHNSVSSDYANVFNTSQASNQDVNAFDLVHFGLQITSIIIIIFSVVLAAGMVAGEHSQGTLKLLMIRPYSRSKVLTSKLLATLIFASIFVIFSALILFIIGWALYGVNFTPVLAVFNGTGAFVISPVLLLLIDILSILIKTTMFIAISLAISAIFRNNVGAVSISIILYFLITILGIIFANSLWYGFLPLSNLDLFKFFGGSFIGNSNTNFLTAMFSSNVFHDVGFYYSLGATLISMALIITLAYLIFKIREIK
ncbi:MAG: ABC transporter permease subunit [Clostridia bacterium]|nr:ABC transporter permease subunit [Clostridia bacterium]